MPGRLLSGAVALAAALGTGGVAAQKRGKATNKKKIKEKIDN